jgi:hypothetical protein
VRTDCLEVCGANLVRRFGRVLGVPGFARCIEKQFGDVTAECRRELDNEPKVQVSLRGSSAVVRLVFV